MCDPFHMFNLAKEETDIMRQSRPHSCHVVLRARTLGLLIMALFVCVCTCLLIPIVSCWSSANFVVCGAGVLGIESGVLDMLWKHSSILLLSYVSRFSFTFYFNFEAGSH